MENPLSITEKTNACEFRKRHKSNQDHMIRQHRRPCAVHSGAWQLGCRRVARRATARGGAWLPCSGACRSVERPRGTYGAHTCTDFDLGLSMHAKSNLRSKQSTIAMFKVIRNPYKYVAFKLSSYVALEHRLQQYKDVCKTQQCVVEKQLTHRDVCVAEKQRM